MCQDVSNGRGDDAVFTSTGVDGAESAVSGLAWQDAKHNARRIKIARRMLNLL
jgi:hypothetical protein